MIAAVTVIVGGAVLFLDRWRTRRSPIDQSPRARDRRKAAAARKELIRRFPDYDLSARRPVVKQAHHLAPGDLIRTTTDTTGDITLAHEGSAPVGDPADESADDFVVFTGFTETRARRSVLVNTCDLDGYGTRTWNVPLDIEVLAYVDEAAGPPR